MRLAILLPLYGAITPNFFVNFINRIHEIYENGKGWEVKIYMKVATVIDRARNELVLDALGDKCDYLLFLDSDIITPRNAIEQLIAMDTDVASGLYFQKAKPYLPVARLLNRNGRHSFLEDFEYNQILDVQGVGLGLCLIKAKIFEKLTFPYFKLDWITDDTGQTYQIAEDLYFCDQVKAAGMAIKLNTGLLLEHDGAPVGRQHFDIYKAELAKDKRDREELLEDLAKFEKVDVKEILKRLETCQELRNEQFDKIVGKNRTPKKLDKYYLENSYEIYDHFNWHLNSRRTFDKQVVEEIKQLYPNKSTEILDFGCGGGQVAYMLACEGYQVTAMEKNKKDIDFIHYRFTNRRKKVKIVPLPLNSSFRNKFDVILCFDVLEHIPDEEFAGVINQIKSLKKPDGRVFATVSFGAEEIHKSHFGSTKEKEQLIMDLAK